MQSGPAAKGTFAVKTGKSDIGYINKAAQEITERFFHAPPSKKAEFQKRDTILPDRFNILGRPKTYTDIEGTTSPEIKSPTLKKGTQGKGLGYGVERKSIEPPSAKMPTDPAEYLLPRHVIW